MLDVIEQGMKLGMCLRIKLVDQKVYYTYV